MSSWCSCLSGCIKVNIYSWSKLSCTVSGYPAQMSSHAFLLTHSENLFTIILQLIPTKLLYRGCVEVKAGVSGQL